MRDDARDWLLSRPESVRAVCRVFPPGCRVVGVRPLITPAPGRVGRVVAYAEHEDGRVLLRVRHEDATELDVDGHCEQGWLRVVGYLDGQAPEDIAAVFDDAGAFMLVHRVPEDE